MATDAFADQVSEAALGVLAEFVVVEGFLADDVTTAAVARVEPFRSWGGSPAGAIETDAGTHLDERSPLRQMRRIFVLDADECDALIFLQHPDGADRNGVAGASLSDDVPFAGGDGGETEHKHRSQHDGYENKEGFLQFPKLPGRTHTLWAKLPILSIPRGRRRESGMVVDVDGSDADF